MNGTSRKRDQGVWRVLNEILGWDFGTKEQFLQRNRTASAPLQEEVLVGCVHFSISEGSSDVPARASAGGNGEVESCATVAL